MPYASCRSLHLYLVDATTFYMGAEETKARADGDGGGCSTRAESRSEQEGLSSLSLSDVVARAVKPLWLVGHVLERQRSKKRVVAVGGAIVSACGGEARKGESGQGERRS